MDNLLELLRASVKPEKRREVAEYFDNHPDDFEIFIGTVFDETDVQTKRLLIDISDLLSKKLALSVITRAIGDSVSDVRVSGLQAAYRTRIDALNDEILSILFDDNEIFDVRKWAIHILATTDPATHGKAIRELARNGSESIELRKEAVFALTNVADEESIGALCTLLGDISTEMRTSGTWALGKIGSSSSIICLLAALEDECDEVRDWAIRGLRDMDDSRALQSLADAMGSAKPEEQIRLIRLLAEKRSEIILRAITETLLSEDSEVRKTAAWAMGVSPYPPAARNLEELLNDPDEQIRNYAKTALMRLGMFDPTDFGLQL